MTRDDDAPFLDEADRDLMDSSAVQPPADFADRVLEARRAERGGRRFVKPRWLAAAAAIVAAAVIVGAVLVWPWRSPGSGSSGELAATTRTTASVGARATAVLEAGAALAWTVRGDGSARVVQSRGAVFYRVERGGAFVVATPAGEVVVAGTCFHVTIAAGTVLVVVYEGSVVVSGPGGTTRLAAGERSLTRTGAAQPGAAMASEPPIADPSRELVALRARVRQLESEMAAIAVEPDKSAELAAMAADCRIAWDLPVVDAQGVRVGAAQAAVLGITEPDHARLEAALAALQARALEKLRRLYAEVTGEAAGPLSWEALQSEIEDKSSERTVQEAFQRISTERAGLAAPPADESALPPVERMYRMLVAIGDEAERETSAIIGAARAHALRTADGGWGSRHSASRGCPAP